MGYACCGGMRDLRSSLYSHSAIGIGVNTATFTAYKAFCETPSRCSRLRADGERRAEAAIGRLAGDGWFSYPDYEAYRDNVHSFSG